MKEAKSMYKGGEIVYASECNYESAKELGILCPFCNEPLFWKDEFARLAPKSKDIVIVEKHFAHYANVDGSVCEKRSISAEGRAFIEQISSESRGQRLRLFERHFLGMIAKSQKLPENPTISLPSKKVKDIVNTSVEFWSFYSKDYIKDFSNQYLDTDVFGDQTKKTYKEDGLPIPDFVLKMDKVDNRLHKQICMEAFDYLLGQKNKKMLEKICSWSLYTGFKTEEFTKTDLPTQKRLVFMASITLILWTQWQEMLEEFKNQKTKGFGKNA